MNTKKRILLASTVFFVCALGLCWHFFNRGVHFNADTAMPSRSVRINNYNNWQSPRNQVERDAVLNTDDIVVSENYTNNGYDPATIRLTNPDAKVYRLFDLSCKADFDSDWQGQDPLEPLTHLNDLTSIQTPLALSKINDPKGVRNGQFLLSARDDWWLRDGNGNIAKENDGTWMLDVGKPGFKEAFLANILSRTNGQGYDGIVFDYWWPYMIRAWVVDRELPVPTAASNGIGYANDDEWFTKAWKPFVGYVMPGLKNAGYKVIGNSVGTYGETDPKMAYDISLLDGTVYETWALGWSNEWLYGDEIAGKIDAFNKDPLITWTADFGLRSMNGPDTPNPEYQIQADAGLAMYYLGLPQDPVQAAKRSYHHYKDQYPFWEKNWDLYIGTPAENINQVTVAGQKKYAWSRKYTGGLVLLNYGSDPSSTETVTFTLDGSKQYFDVVGTEYSGSITLPVHGSKILRSVNKSNVTPTATISASPSSGTFTVGQEFSVDIMVNGGGQNFTTFGADVAVSNLTVVSLTAGPTVSNWTTNPSASSLSFFGGVQNQALTATVYTLRVKGTASGPASIAITNGIVKSTDGINVNDIFSSAVNASYAIAFSADAGPDKTTNASFTQTGTAVGGSTYQWSKTSGPGTVNFGTPTALSTTISATTDGTYTIRLTVNDGAGHTAYDEMILNWDTTPPSVDAGTNKTTNKSVTQTSTVTGASTYQWSKTSGSGSITFGTPTAKDTTISAAADGSYVIRLTAADALGNSAYDEMTLVWDTTAPTVSAGDDKSNYINRSLVLTGTATGATTYLWNKVSGPGNVTFNPSSGLVTNIAADAVGSYVIKLTATDAAGNSASDTANLTIQKNGDISNDSVINADDFSILMFNWGPPKNPMADLDGNGTVNNDDFTILMFWWGK